MDNMRAQVRSWWVSLPMATQGLFALCMSVWLLTALGVTSVHSGCAGASLVLGKWKIWRLLTSPFYHVGLLHLVMNMLALLSLLPPVERSHGTSGGICIVTVYALLAQFFAILPATVLHVVLGVDHLVEWRSCVVGVSGVLFGLLTLECTTDETGLLPSTRRTFFGIAIPGRVYPWLLAIVLQLLVPSASFATHVGGILAAQVVPPLALRSTITWVDNRLPGAMKSSASFVPANRAPLSGGGPGAGAGWTQSWRGGTSTAAERSGSVRSPPPTGVVAFTGPSRTLGTSADEVPSSAPQDDPAAVTVDIDAAQGPTSNKTA